MPNTAWSREAAKHNLLNDWSGWLVAVLFVLLYVCFSPHLAKALLLTAVYFACPSQIDENVQREIINHRSLRHPNIVRFKEVCAAAFLDY